MTRLYLIRHAEAEGNIKRIFQGHTDADVSENGRRQLEKLAERFRNIKLDAVYSSPLKRAYNTARAVNLHHGLKITVLDGLMEINGGRWEGEKWEEIPDLFPEENYAWVNEPWRFSPEGGESMQEVYVRIWNTITDIIKANPGKNIAAASHGCAIRNFACRAKGLPLTRLREVEWFENTSVSIFDFNDDLVPHIATLGDVSHLDEETMTLAKQTWWKDSETSGVER